MEINEQLPDVFLPELPEPAYWTDQHSEKNAVQAYSEAQLKEYALRAIMQFMKLSMIANSATDATIH